MLDVDGIIADFMGAAIKVMNKISGKNITADQVTEWEVTTALDDDAHKLASKIEFNKAGFASTFEIYDGSIEAVEQLKQLTDLHFVTSPTVTNPTWVHDRVNWLSKHFKVNPKDVHHTSKKWVVCGDVMLDDHPENLNLWVEQWPGKLPLLWDRPYNRIGVSGLKRITSWKEVISEVKNLIERDRVHQSER